MSLSNEQIVDAIASKSLMELMELVKALEEKFGVSAAAPLAVRRRPGRCRRRPLKSRPSSTSC
jgi:large subunit ribosomal protein L7/L12